MINIKYEQLFGVELKHNFYSSGKSNDLQIVPTNDCQTLLMNYGLKFLTEDTGVKVFAKVNITGGSDILKSPLPEGSRFTFILKLKRPTFENYTLLNLSRSKDQRYYFSNLVSNLSADSMPLLVSNTTNKVVSDSDLIRLSSGTFSFVETSAANRLSSELRFTDSGEILRQELNNHNDTFNFSYDLKGTLSGRAAFFIGGTQRALVYVGSSSEYADAFGIIDIFYKSTLPATYQFQKPDNSVDPKIYAVAFSPRATRWRYIIAKKFNQAVTGVSVAKTNGTPIAFNEQSGAPPGVFIMASGSLIALREEPVIGIKLIDQDNNVLIANLPNPPLTMIKQEGNDIFSDILVTI